VLGPQMTQNLSLILHELVTNALKHGALSVAKGRVSLRLECDSTHLMFSWEERDGPPVLPVARSGFGSRILGTFAKSFCRSVEACYGENGLRYVLQINSDQIRRAEPAPVTPAVLAPATPRTNVSEARPPRSWLGRTPARLAR